MSQKFSHGQRKLMTTHKQMRWAETDEKRNEALFFTVVFIGQGERKSVIL